MITYAFRCSDCNEAFELKMHATEYDAKKQAGIECPKCHRSNVLPQIWNFEVRTSRKSAAY